MTRESQFIIGSYSVPSPWVGSPDAHGKGLSIAYLDVSSGEMRIECTIDALNPSFMRRDPSGNNLWVITEPQRGGDLLIYQLGRSGALELRGRTPTGADAPCHLEIDFARRLVFVSHFHGHTVSVLPLADDGIAGTPIAFLDSPTVVGSVDRGDVLSRPHSATRVRSDELIVTDTGRDMILLYRVSGLDSFELVDTLVMPTGTGPRHLAWSDQTSTAFVSHQESASLGVVRLTDTVKGARLQLQGVIDSPGLGRYTPRPSEVVMHRSGRIVYMANRIDNSLSIFELNDGSAGAELIGCVDVLGESPRQFALTPDGRFLLVANGDSDEVVSFAVSDDGRAVTWSGHRLKVNTPNFICI